MKKAIATILVALLPFPTFAACTGTWYDTFDPTQGYDGGDTGGENTVEVYNQGFNLPAGQVQALRVYTTNATFSNPIKAALYDNSGNLVVGQEQYSTAGTNLYQTFNLTSPATITAGTYKFAYDLYGNSNDFLIAYKDGYTAGTFYLCFNNFGTCPYSTFPTATIASNEWSQTKGYAVGVCVLPSGGSTPAPLSSRAALLQGLMRLLRGRIIIR